MRRRRGLASAAACGASAAGARLGLRQTAQPCSGQTAHDQMPQGWCPGPSSCWPPAAQHHRQRPWHAWTACPSPESRPRTQVKLNCVGLDATVIVEGRDLVSLKLLEASIILEVGLQSRMQVFGLREGHAAAAVSPSPSCRHSSCNRHSLPAASPPSAGAPAALLHGGASGSVAGCAASAAGVMRVRLCRRSRPQRRGCSPRSSCV